METKIKVGVLGCTGNVGQKIIFLLQNHPYFQITDLVASEQSAGQSYAQRVHWREQGDIPEAVRQLIIKKPQDHLEARLLFSGLDASVAGEVESYYAARGHAVVSNSRNHRMDHDVPLVIPEINGPQVELIRQQASFKSSGGYIVTNPNCSTIVLALALYPIFQRFDLTNIVVTTMQAISGAGYPGVPSFDILGNVVPHIGGEEEKMEMELPKIFGEMSHFGLSASCNRVPVMDGHTLSVFFQCGKPATKEQLIDALVNFPSLDLPSSPKQVVVYTDNPCRPQPRLDASRGNGMTVTVGNIRPSSVMDWKLTAFGHNTVRGAAGAAILNAEYLVKQGLL